MFVLLSDAASQASCGKMMSVMRSSLSMRRLRRKDKGLQSKQQSCLTAAAAGATAYFPADKLINRSVSPEKYTCASEGRRSSNM